MRLRYAGYSELFLLCSSATAASIPLVVAAAAFSPALLRMTFSMKASPALYDDRTRGPLAQ